MRCIVFVLWIIIQVSSEQGNREYGMDMENCPLGTQVINGAVVRSQANEKYYQNGLECIATFEAKHEHLLVQIQALNIYSGRYGNCSEDYLTITSYTSNESAVVDVDRVCGNLDNLPRRTFQSLGRKIIIVWVTSANTTAQKSYIGFKLTLTSFSTSRNNICSNGLVLCPRHGRCVSSALVCDGVRHCEEGYDENDKLCPTKRKSMESETAPTTPPVYKTTSVGEITESETFWFISMLGIIVISILGAIIAVIRRKHIERRDELNSRIRDCSNEESDEAFGYNRQESVLSTGSASNNVEPPPEYDDALTCSSDPITLPPSYSEVDFDSSSGNRTPSIVTTNNPLFDQPEQSPSSANNLVFILDSNSNEQSQREGQCGNSNSRTKPQNGVHVYIPSEDTISEEEDFNIRL